MNVRALVAVEQHVLQSREGRVGKIQSGFDDAGEQIARDAQPTARTTLPLQIGLAAAHYFVPQLDAGHLLGAFDAAGSGAQDQILTRQGIELGGVEVHGPRD